MTADTPKGLIIVGGGGHGRVVVEAAIAMSCFPTIAVIDPAPADVWPYESVPRHADDAELDATPDGWRAVIALGNAYVRQRLFNEYRQRGFDMGPVIHPAASVSPTARIGAGAMVMAGAIVVANADVGDGTIVNHGAVVEHDASVGQFAHLGPNAALAGGASLGDRSFLGANASVRHGIAVGADIVIGNGAAVVKPLSSPGTYGGVPVRRLSK